MIIRFENDPYEMKNLSDDFYYRVKEELEKKYLTYGRNRVIY